MFGICLLPSPITSLPPISHYSAHLSVYVDTAHHQIDLICSTIHTISKRYQSTTIPSTYLPSLPLCIRSLALFYLPYLFKFHLTSSKPYLVLELCKHQILVFSISTANQLGEHHSNVCPLHPFDFISTDGNSNHLNSEWGRC